MALYVISSLGCVFTESLSMLIFYRVLEGFSASSIISVCIAIVKDCVSGPKRGRILAFI